MEIEYFVHPKKLDECGLLSDDLQKMEVPVLTAEEQEEKQAKMEKMTVKKMIESKTVKTKWHAYWLAASLRWLHSLGISREKLRLRQHVKAELSHYSSETWDVEYEYPWGWKELQGIANRSDYDLSQHQKFSGKDMSYLDEESHERVVPHVIEPSWGLDRLFFTILLDAYSESTSDKGSSSVLKLDASIAPVQIAVFPLMKKDGLAEKARAVYQMLREKFACEYDEGGSIGKRYARQDEIGTPYCVTVDYESLEKDDVTVRERDSGNQRRVPVKELAEIIGKCF
jgi:glycyl-tRNA synthetase